jgi:hypothetical protein
MWISPAKNEMSHAKWMIFSKKTGTDRDRYVNEK